VLGGDVLASLVLLVILALLLILITSVIAVLLILITLVVLLPVAATILLSLAATPSLAAARPSEPHHGRRSRQPEAQPEEASTAQQHLLACPTLSFWGPSTVPHSPSLFSLLCCLSKLTTVIIAV
jgi:hypothetical protein